MERLALTALVLGLISVLYRWSQVSNYVPFGFFAPAPIVGLVLGIVSRNSSRRLMGVIGAILCGLVLLEFLVGFVAFIFFP